MELITSITNWTIKTFAPLGWAGLFVLAFIEASLFPIPPDILLAALVLEGLLPWWVLAAICTAGSVLGGLLGYGIGHLGEEAILRRMFSEQRIRRWHRMLERYEAWAVAIAGLTPIPYKLVTIGAGVFYLNLPRFVIASVLSRGARFFGVAWLVWAFGEEVIHIVDRYLLLIGLAAVVIATAYVYHRLRRRRITSAPSRRRRR